MAMANRLSHEWLVRVPAARDILCASQAHSDVATLDLSVRRSSVRAYFVQVDPETTLQEVLSCVLASDLGCLTEVARGKLLAIVTERNLLRAADAVLTRQAT